MQKPAFANKLEHYVAAQHSQLGFHVPGTTENHEEAWSLSKTYLSGRPV